MRTKECNNKDRAAPSFEYIKLFKQQQIATVAAVAATKTKAFDSASPGQAACGLCNLRPKRQRAKLRIALLTNTRQRNLGIFLAPTAPLADVYWLSAFVFPDEDFNHVYMPEKWQVNKKNEMSPLG